MNPTKLPTKQEQANLQPAPGSPGFLPFIFKNKSNLYLLAGMLSLSILMFIVYKYCIPMPDFSSDSHGYINSAMIGEKLFYRPLGYSRFLSILRGISSSALFTVAVQYFLLIVAALFLFFSVDYLYGFKNKWVKYTALVLMTLNPGYLVLANLIFADAAFAAFTVFWFASLLWIQKKASWWALLCQVVFLYWCFELRYNALFYPALSVVVLLFAAKAKLYYRLAGIVLSLSVIGVTYNMQVRLTEQLTSTPVFSGFSGWMMANSALLIYPYAAVETTEFEDPRMQIVDQFVKRFIDSIAPEAKKELREHTLSWPYLWDKQGPLRKIPRLLWATA